MPSTCETLKLRPPIPNQNRPTTTEAAVGRSKNPLVYLSNLSPRLKDREAPRVLGPIGGATLVYYARFRRWGGQRSSMA